MAPLLGLADVPAPLLGLGDAPAPLFSLGAAPTLAPATPAPVTVKPGVFGLVPGDDFESFLVSLSSGAFERPLRLRATPDVTPERDAIV